MGKVFSREELQKIADLCLKHKIIILSDEVYDRLYYVPFTRIATLSPEVEQITLTVGSAGKNFYATGWRVGEFVSLIIPVSISTDKANRLAHGPSPPHPIRLGRAHPHLLFLRLASPRSLRHRYTPLLLPNPHPY